MVCFSCQSDWAFLKFMIETLTNEEDEAAPCGHHTIPEPCFGASAFIEEENSAPKRKISIPFQERIQLTSI